MPAPWNQAIDILPKLFQLVYITDENFTGGIDGGFGFWTCDVAYAHVDP
jgi:hypothetical protein